MKTIIKTMLAVWMMLPAISCKKENSNFQSSLITDASSISGAAAVNVLSVKIGAQGWMNKNLNVTHYRNGDAIPHVQSAAKWATLTTGAWCWYNNDSANGSIYGRLYNWYAVNDPRGLAPVGWHIASDVEWTTLVTFLGGTSLGGGGMKSTGTTKDGTGLWRSPNTGATNSSSFTALPGGFRLDNGSFHGITSAGFWWTSTQGPDVSYSAWLRSLRYDSAGIVVKRDGKRDGMSVRCVRD